MAWEFLTEGRRLPASQHFSVMHQDCYSPVTLSASVSCRNMMCQGKVSPAVCALSLWQRGGLVPSWDARQWVQWGLQSWVCASSLNHCRGCAQAFFPKIRIWVQSAFLKAVREINGSVDNVLWFLWGGLPWEHRTLRARFKQNNRSTLKGKNSSLFILVSYFMSLRNGHKFAFFPSSLIFFCLSHKVVFFFFTCCVESGF